ncbi:MAG: glycosyltransferase [Armatimonadota bacterium]
MSSLDLSRVTVIVPTYNRAASLRRCVEALLRCDPGGAQVELRVSDDGSTDDTEAVVADLKRAAPPAFRVHYHRGENGGQSAARNRAIAASDTDVLLFTDDDCEPDRGWIAAMLRAGWHPGLGAVGGHLVAAARGNRVSRYCRYMRYNEYPPDDAPPRFVNSANCAYLRSALVELGGYEQLLPRLVDQDLGRRIALAGYELRYQPEARVDHHHRESVRVLARDYWRRGYSSILRNVIWDAELPITPARIRSERRTLYRRGARMLLALPFEVVKLPFQGVAVGDAPLFAYLNWLQWVQGRAGQIAVMEAILAGEQSTTRTARVAVAAESAGAASS